MKKKTQRFEEILSDRSLLEMKRRQPVGLDCLQVRSRIFVEIGCCEAAVLSVLHQPDGSGDTPAFKMQGND